MILFHFNVVKLIPADSQGQDHKPGSLGRLLLQSMEPLLVESSVPCLHPSAHTGEALDHSPHYARARNCERHFSAHLL